MKDIALYILKKYGYELNANELDIIVQWYERNKNTFKDEKDFDLKIRAFLVEKFPNKELHLFEEDTSNMNYLLSMLKNRKNS